jgi:copper homeostasis protein
LAWGRVAFHRAFDFAADTSAALEQLVQLGFARILTSGGQSTALDGATSIADLIGRAAGRIEILPGGGIKPENVARVVRATGCSQVHAAARSARIDRSLLRSPDLATAMGAPNLNVSCTDADVVAGLRRELDRLPSLP